AGIGVERWAVERRREQPAVAVDDVGAYRRRRRRDRADAADMRFGAGARHRHDLDEAQRHDHKNKGKQRRRRDQPGPAGIEQRGCALVFDDRGAGRRRPEMPWPARVLLETLDRPHHRASAICAISASSELAAGAAPAFARRTVAAGRAPSPATSSGGLAVSAWRVGPVTDGAGLSTARLTGSGVASASGATGPGLASTSASGGAAGGAAGARGGISSTLRCSCLVVMAASPRKRRFSSASRSGWLR